MIASDHSTLAIGAVVVASPQLEDGYTQLANELLMALFVSDFPKFEKVILGQLVLALYGPTKRRSFRIDVREIAETLCCDPSNVRKARNNLIACGVLKALEDGSFCLVKDWERWVKNPSGSPSDPFNRRIGPGERRIVTDTTSRFGLGYPSKNKRKSEANEPHIKELLGQPAPPQLALGGLDSPPTTSPGGAGWPPVNVDMKARNASASPDPDSTSIVPLAGASARPSEDLDNRELKKRVHTHSSREQADEFEPFMSPPDPPRPPSPPDPRTIRMHAFMLKATISADYPDGREDMAEHAASEVASWLAQDYPEAIVRSAIQKAVRKGGRLLGDALAFSGYVQSCLNGYSDDRKSRPDAPPAVKPSDINRPKYHVAPPRPKPPSSGPEGAR